MEALDLHSAQKTLKLRHVAFNEIKNQATGAVVYVPPQDAELVQKRMAMIETKTRLLHQASIAFFEIVDSNTVIVGAVRRQREDDYV